MKDGAMGSKLPIKPPVGLDSEPSLPPPPPRKYEGKLEGDVAILRSLIDDAKRQERESLAKEIESGRFCHERDHKFDDCNCREIAAFIRAR